LADVWRSIGVTRSQFSYRSQTTQRQGNWTPLDVMRLISERAQERDLTPEQLEDLLDDTDDAHA
jgi:hypothetical protein